jgi:hypothetical protein
MAMIFHKTKLQQKLSRSLSRAASSRSVQCKFGTPKEEHQAKSLRCNEWQSALMKREEERCEEGERMQRMGECTEVRECVREERARKVNESKTESTASQKASIAS